MDSIRNKKSRFSRKGYDNIKTIRDGIDPRVCGTQFIHDPRDIMRSMWYSYFWPRILPEMINTEEAIYHHAFTTHGRGDHVLFSKYQSGDFYGSHIDTDMDCVITAVLMLSPKQTFKGGDLIVEDYLIPFENNKLVVFPSCFPHEVTKIDNESDDYNNQRFSLQYFCSAVRVKTPLIDESSNI